MPALASISICWNGEASVDPLIAPMIEDFESPPPG